MSTQYFGAITALQFDTSSDKVFAKIVEDLDTIFRPSGLGYSTPKWHSDTVALIERDNLKIVLGWLPAVSKGEPCFLMLAAGHTTDGGNLLVTRSTCELVRDVLERHLASYLSFDTVFHTDATQPVDRDLVSTVADILDRESEATLPASLPGFDETRHMCPRRDAPAGRRAALAQAKGKRPAPADILNVANVNLRAETSPEEAASLPKRLTVCALGASMLIQAPPVGATLLAYTALKGISSSPKNDDVAA